MTKPYYTRKDLIGISIALFYSFIIIFCGMCIDANYTFVSKKNPIAAMAEAFGFKPIVPNLSGFAMLLLVAIYIVVLVAMVLYERRYAKLNKISSKSPKMILTYSLSVLVCIILSYGVGILLQSPINWENIKNSSLFILHSIALASIIYAVLLILFGGILMFAVNFIFVDKPFKFFGQDEVAVLDDDNIDADITGSFDVDSNTTTQGGAGEGVGGVGGAGGFGGDGTASVVSKAEELDDREKVFPGLSKIDIEYDGFAVESIPSDDVTLEDICVKFRNYLAKVEKLYFDLDTIRIFISGFATSHFMILEGLSGTGKSSLPRYFAKFCNGKVLFMPVQATWRDKTNILGYFNNFSKTYTETDFLVELYRANYNPDQINLFVLDEMNISRVEYYFADLLSVLEYPEEDWKLRLMQLPYNFVAPVKVEDGFIQIPNNSYFVGTANKDDSTFTITDKVYDRAITIDFDYRNDPFEVEEEVSTIQLSKTKLQSLYDEALNNEEYRLTEEELKNFQNVAEFIYEQFDITFGNRILNQVETLVPVFVACGGTKEDALDFLLSRKVICKIEGRFEEYVKGALKQLQALINKTYGNNKFKQSEKIINSLIRKL